MHDEAYNFFSRSLAQLNIPTTVVELGSRNVNGTLRGLLPSYARYIGVDITDGPDVDVVADAADFVPEVTPNFVLCAEVLEHTPRAAEICANAHRMLVDNGFFLLSAASDPRAEHSAVDGGPGLRDGEYYHNVSPDDLAEWLKPFSRYTIGTHPRGDIYAVAQK